MPPLRHRSNRRGLADQLTPEDLWRPMTLTKRRLRTRWTEPLWHVQVPILRCFQDISNTIPEEETVPSECLCIAAHSASIAYNTLSVSTPYLMYVMGHSKLAPVPCHTEPEHDTHERHHAGYGITHTEAHHFLSQSDTVPSFNFDLNAMTKMRDGRKKNCEQSWTGLVPSGATDGRH